MDNKGSIARIKYYKGQMLTARDFEDQQQYHRESLRLFLKRFPYGILSGLEVELGKDKNDNDALIIKEGLAIDRKGQQIVVSGEDISILLDDIPANERYLSLKYSEKDFIKSPSACDSSTKSNRTQEGAVVDWKNEPNCYRENVDDESKTESWITVGLIEGDNPDFTIKPNPATDLASNTDSLGRYIRIQAQLIDSDQIVAGAITADKIKKGTITAEKLAEDIAATGPAGGDLTGDYPAPTIKTNAVNGDKLLSDPAIDEQRAVDTDHIKNNAIKSAKIADYVKDSDPETGIKTAHIQDGAIDKNKLATDSVITAKVANYVKDSDPETGIKTDHIQDGAIDKNKLATDSVITAKVANYVKDSDPETGIKTDHIQDGAIDKNKLATDSVITAKVANYVKDSDPETGIKTDHIQDGAVTSPKLSLIEETKTTTGTFSELLDNPVVIFEGAEEFNKIRFPHVIPLTPGFKLFWRYQVEVTASDQMKYHFTIEKDVDGICDYLIRFVKLN